MKRWFLLCIVINICVLATAQNVGIGTTSPTTKLDVNGNFRVTAEYTEPTGTPIEYTMINGQTGSILSGYTRVYDPGGPSGNYLPNLTASFNTGEISYYYGTNESAEVIIENIDLGTGDSLLLFEYNIAAQPNTRVYAVGNGFNGQNIKVNFFGEGFQCTFKSNNDASVGSGFSLLYKKKQVASLPAPPITPGRALVFYSQKAALRSGFLHSSDNIGFHSTAMGEFTIASGNNSTAMGDFATASGSNSIAIGSNTTASGNNSTAMGNQTTAAGNYSTAMGKSLRVSGDGSFAIGDNGSTSVVTYAGANRMHMRFANGYRLYTSSDHSTGVQMNAGGNSWASISDYRKKENYLQADGKSFLHKISNMQLGSWNYIGQDKKTYRHYGPMAQEFYKHFGNDGIGTIGNDTTIATADIDGVMMIAIQALVKEN